MRSCHRCRIRKEGNQTGYYSLAGHSAGPVQSIPVDGAMMNHARRTMFAGVLGGIVAVVVVPAAWAASARQLDLNATRVLQSLYAAQARGLGTKAKAVLVFPKIIKA